MNGFAGKNSHIMTSKIAGGHYVCLCVAIHNDDSMRTTVSIKNNNVLYFMSFTESMLI